MRVLRSWKVCVLSGEVGRTLPRITIDGIFEAERFDLHSGRWLPCRSISASGAFRISRGFTRQYVFRDAVDVVAGLATRSTPQLAKHLAAQAQRASR